MKRSFFDDAPLWVTGWLFLAACEVPPADSPNAAEGEPATTTEVTVTQTEPPPMTEPEPPASEPAPPPEAPQDGVRETDEQTRGRLAPAKINAVLAEHNPSFNQCYSKGLAARPGLAGTVTLIIVISPEGTVPHAEIDEDQSTLSAPEVHTCLIDEAKSLRFDKPTGGRVVTQYPLDFKPTPPAGPAGG